MFLLDGLLFCYECKHKIGVRGKKNGNYYMVCNNYRRNSKLKLCTSHGFSYSDLEETVIKHIKQLFKDIDTDIIKQTLDAYFENLYEEAFFHQSNILSLEELLSL